jgi:propionate CoA-transferase
VESLALAEAAKNSGGIVIVQAEFLAKAKTLHPKKVMVPGLLVDHVVIATRMDSSCQTEGTYYEPSFAGDLRIPLQQIPTLELGERKIIARRAAMEQPKAIPNFGIGMPSDVATVARGSVSDQLMMTCESGSVGGCPVSAAISARL